MVLSVPMLHAEISEMSLHAAELSELRPPHIAPAHHPGPMLALIAMAQLIVRDIPQEVVARLKQRAAELGHSAEAEHREILRRALLAPAAPSLKAMLNDIPDVGRESDFVRPRRTGRRVAL